MSFIDHFFSLFLISHHITVEKDQSLKAQRHKLLSASRLSIKSLLLFLYSSKRSKRKLSIIMASSLSCWRLKKSFIRNDFQHQQLDFVGSARGDEQKRKLIPKKTKMMFYLLTICSPTLISKHCDVLLIISRLFYADAKNCRAINALDEGGGKEWSNGWSIAKCGERRRRSSREASVLLLQCSWKFPSSSLMICFGRNFREMILFGSSMQAGLCCTILQ